MWGLFKKRNRIDYFALAQSIMAVSHMQGKGIPVEFDYKEIGKEVWALQQERAKKIVEDSKKPIGTVGEDLLTRYTAYADEQRGLQALMMDLAGKYGALHEVRTVLWDQIGRELDLDTATYGYHIDLKTGDVFRTSPIPEHYVDENILKSL